MQQKSIARTVVLIAIDTHIANTRLFFQVRWLPSCVLPRSQIHAVRQIHTDTPQELRVTACTFCVNSSAVAYSRLRVVLSGASLFYRLCTLTVDVLDGMAGSCGEAAFEGESRLDGEPAGKL